MQLRQRAVPTMIPRRVTDIMTVDE